MRVLMVEDDATLANDVASALRPRGIEVDVAETVADGVVKAAAASYDVLVLDRMLPDGEGLDVLIELRRLEVLTPALALSALAETAHKVEGLERGVDDYLGKPFALSELEARLRAVHRRANAQPHPEVLVIGDLEVWLKSETAARGGQPLRLTSNEFKLLRLLAEHVDDVVTRAMILERVLGYRPGFDPGSTVVDVNVSRLRKKLDQPFEAKMLETLPRTGYVLRRPTI
ncbi:MAG: response regulator transcription factor [Pseudomonadota bacterium]